MILKAIIKRISIKNNDTDSYITLSLELNNKDINLNDLYNLKHKALILDIKQDSL